MGYQTQHASKNKRQIDNFARFIIAANCIWMKAARLSRSRVTWQKSVTKTQSQPLTVTKLTRPITYHPTTATL